MFEYNYKEDGMMDRSVTQAFALLGSFQGVLYRSLGFNGSKAVDFESFGRF